MRKTRRASPIVDALRQERVRQGLRQWEVADTAGYSRETLAAWETYTRMPSLPAIEDWAESLGMALHIGERA